MTSRRATVVFLVLLVGSMTGAVATVRALDRLRLSATDEELYIPSAPVLRRLSLGYTGLMADLYWTRAVQYFGSRHHERAAHYPLLSPLLDITTQLDPRLMIAYEFGSIFLAQQPPEGAGQPEKAIELVRRGIQTNPGAWRLYYHLGYIQALELHDYSAAAHTFEQGSRLPGAQPWMKIMAAILAQHASERDLARLLWGKIYESTEDASIRRNAAQHLRALQVDDDVQRLEKIIDDFRSRFGRPLANWNELVATGFLRRIPTDPLGKPYRLAPDGHVYVQSPQDLPFIKYGRPPQMGPGNIPSPPLSLPGD
ncbi:MAG TPA: hypothetical protein VFA60_12725 [Terriglobales bacterium]|nr:hypothetical protein [Terriglobales bacterium]